MTAAAVRVALGAQERSDVGAASVPVALQLATDDSGVYEVVAIDAGVGNGWVFSPAVIERAAPLFGRVNVYLGHAGPTDRGPNDERKPEHLAGVFSGRYDPASAAIRGRLRLVGPAAPLARAVADAYLLSYSAGEPAPDVGLSASLYISVDGHTRHRNYARRIARRDRCAARSWRQV